MTYLKGTLHMSLFLNNNCGTDYLSKENTACLKGLCAVGVLVHHLYQYSRLVQNIYLGALLQALGFLMVALFFFLSGYGLQVSFQRDPDTYLKGFMRQRVVPYYLIIVILIAIYSFAVILIESGIDYILVIRSFFFSETIVANGWYLQVQLLLYFAFYGINRLWKSSRIKKIVLFACLLVYALVLMAKDFGPTRYVGTFAFLIGIIWAENKKRIDVHLNNKPNTVIIYALAFASFVVFFLLWGLTDGYISIFFQMICESLFVVCIILCLRFIPINCFVTRFLGRISLGIYVVQGIFLKAFRSELVNIENGWLYVALVCLGTFLGGGVLTPLFEKIYLLFRIKKNVREAE